MSCRGDGALALDELREGAKRTEHWLHSLRYREARSASATASQRSLSLAPGESEMRILALEPYYGGSHRAFLDQWITRSRHDWRLLTLPAHHWKWRMRHSGITLAREAQQTWQQGDRWDAVFATDMLDLAAFVALVAPEIAALPRIFYFHENQLTYPPRYAGERDMHFAMTNFTSAAAADQVWFNSEFHRRSFLTALRDWLGKMPDYIPRAEIDAVNAKSRVASPGITVSGQPSQPLEGPLHIAWAARWEHDKNPETFFEALRMLKDRGVAFRLTVCGQSFREIPAVFASAGKEFTTSIVHWGEVPEREGYLQRLAAADVFVSTAHHEFFGLAALEAIALGLFPLLPRRLAYPELLQLDEQPRAAAFFYDGSADELANRLCELAHEPHRLAAPDLRDHLRTTASRYDWSQRAQTLDRRMHDSLIVRKS